MPKETVSIPCLLILRLLSSPGPWFNIKMSSYQYRKSHCGDKTILRPSYLHNGISYTGKITSLYWIRAQGISRQDRQVMVSHEVAFQLPVPSWCHAHHDRKCRQFLMMIPHEKFSMSMVNTWRVRFFRGNINIYILCHSSTLIWHRYLKSFLKLDKDLHILHNQYHGCWRPGNARSQGITNHDTDLVKQR